MNTHENANIICLGIIIFIIVYLMICDNKNIKETFSTLENDTQPYIVVKGNNSDNFPDGIIDIGIIKTNI